MTITGQKLRVPLEQCNTVVVPAPTDLVAGELVLINEVVGSAVQAALTGVDAVIVTYAPKILVACVSASYVVGEQVFFDATNKEVTAVSTSPNRLCGFVTEAGTTVETVEIELVGDAGSVVADDVNIGGDLDVAGATTVVGLTASANIAGVDLTLSGGNVNLTTAETTIDNAVGDLILQTDASSAGDILLKALDTLELTVGNGTVTVANILAALGALNVTGALTANGAFTVASSQVTKLNLPTSDPSETGQLWSDSLTVKVSA